MARVEIINEARRGEEGDWCLCFQWCRYVYDDGATENGYRFIWRRPNGNLQAARGQARIPSVRAAQSLIQQAKAEGWGDYDE